MFVWSFVFEVLCVPLMPQHYIYRGSRLTVYLYLVQRGHSVLKENSQLQDPRALLYVGKSKNAVVPMYIYV